jgi:hypothetical protein
MSSTVKSGDAGFSRTPWEVGAGLTGAESEVNGKAGIVSEEVITAKDNRPSTNLVAFFIALPYLMITARRL